MKKVFLWASLMLIATLPAAAQTCDVTGDVTGDGVFDFDDPKYLFVYLFAGGNDPVCPDQSDANGDGNVDIADVVTMLDEVACNEAELGDVNGSGVVALADVEYLLSYLFLGGPEPVPCLEVADVNLDGKVNLADAAELGANLPCPGVPGDVNGDERVDVADLYLVALSYSEDVTFVPCDLAGDLNQDGRFDIADLIAYFDLF